MNLHAHTAVDGRDRKQLERLAKYLLRPPFAQDAVHWLPDGRVRLAIPRRARCVLSADGKPTDLDAPAPPTSGRIAWAQLLARVFSIDVLNCPRPGCDGRLRPCAAVLDRHEIARLLHGARAPPVVSPPGQLSFW